MNSRSARKLLAAIPLLVTLLVITAPAHAADHETDRSVLLRVAPGVGKGSMFGDGIQGLDTDMSIAFGGFINQLVALHLTLAGSVVFDDYADGYVFGGGIGFTCYEVSNVYWSVSILMCSAKTSVHSTSFAGVEVEALLGKEWDVTDSIGMGAAIGFLGHNLTEKPADDQTGGSLTLRLSFTVR